MYNQNQILLKLIDTIPDLIFYRDLEGTFQACNQAYADYTDKGIMEIIGRKLHEVLRKDEADKYLELDQLVIKSGQPHQADIWLSHPDGSMRLYDTVRTPLRDDKGNITGVAGICRDVTEKNRLRKLAQEEDRKYRSVLEANPDPIIVYDTAGSVDYANAAFINTFGWSLEECKGQKIAFVPQENLPETMEMISKVKRGEGFNDIESQRLSKNGEKITISASGAVYRDREGEIKGSIITLRNITHQKRIELQLQQAQKMEAVGALAGGIAHDFNNLLTAIQGHISVIQLKSELEPLLEKKLSRIEKIIARGANLTKQLLGFARGGKYQLEVLNLNQVINDSLELFARTHKELTVTTKLAEKLYRVEADQGQIDQLLLNLYVNAWQAIQDFRKSGRLTIETTNFEINERSHLHLAPGSYVRIAISDNGCGMNKETQKRIFEPFFSTKQRGTGTGLGLSSVYGIVKNHGGMVTVYSEPKLGTTFNIYLPAVTKNVKEQEKGDLKIVAGQGTILVVDDEAIVREVNVELISELGYQVISANNGRQALEIYAEKKNNIDLVILDMIMPEMSGAEVFSLLKEINPDVKVLLASGYSVEGQAARIMAQGCNGFIQKPFTLELLSNKIDIILGKER
ncbi:MAG: PAS domain S-box protein [Deltaproteobacteria bacterium]|nr:PAS domain S-box protein [Deltaproteobacteria bacterium]